MKVLGPINSGVAVGGNGEATIHASTPQAIVGRLIAAYVKYNDSPPNTSDVVIKTLGTGSGDAPSVTLLTVSNANTSGWFYPRVTPHGTNGAALDALTVLEPVPFAGQINVLLDDANAGDNVDVWLLYE